MSSPFEIFRRNQFSVVILIALSMLAFVIFGAIQDPQNIPTGLWILALGLIAAVVGWVYGLKEGKPKSYAGWAAALGILLGALVAQRTQPAPAVVIGTEELTAADIDEESRGVGLANQFVARLMQETGGRSQQIFLLPGDGDTASDIAFRRILDQKAEEMGLEVTPERVNEELKRLTQGRVTSKDITSVRKELRLGEAELYDLLADNFRRRQTFFMLNGYANAELPPASYYGLYRQLNERRNVQAIEIPVEAFVEEIDEPTANDLEQYLIQYRESVPNYGPDGRPEPGRPGFMQPPRYTVGAIEIPLEVLKDQVEEPTEEELRELYALRYGTQQPEGISDEEAEEAARRLMQEIDATAEETPNVPPTVEEAAEKQEATPGQTPPEKAAGDAPTQSGESEGGSESGESNDDSSSSDAAAGDAAETSSLMRQPQRYLVAFWQDEPDVEGLGNAIEALHGNAAAIADEAKVS